MRSHGKPLEFQPDSTFSIKFSYQADEEGESSGVCSFTVRPSLPTVSGQEVTLHLLVFPAMLCS